jgi:hypothetical protein
MSLNRQLALCTLHFSLCTLAVMPQHLSRRSREQRDASHEPRLRFPQHQVCGSVSLSYRRTACSQAFPAGCNPFAGKRVWTGRGLPPTSGMWVAIQTKSRNAVGGKHACCDLIGTA